ncbi:MAG: signal peptidase I [Patescibacteria group bacterium]
MENRPSNKPEGDLGPKSDKEVYQGIGAFIFEVVKIVFLAFLIFAPIRFFIFQPFFVQGASMEPNFENSEYLIINELGYKAIAIGGENKLVNLGPFKKLERGLPVVFRYPKNRSQYFIKRVIGLPGEKVEVKNKQVRIYNSKNPEGFILDESNYLSSSVETLGDLTLALGKDEYFMMGDNRMFSSDSRSWGAVKEGDIIGTVLFRAWPLNRLEIF